MVCSLCESEGDGLCDACYERIEKPWKARITALEVKLAEVQAQRDAWTETAAQHLRNEEYYRGLVVQIGKLFGVSAMTSDDGSVQNHVLCAKVPELVVALRAQLAEVQAALGASTSHGMKDVRALWANGRVCEECSHALCVFFRETTEKCDALQATLAEAEAELTTMREEHAIWEKHSLVQIVKQRDAFRATLAQAREIFAEIRGKESPQQVVLPDGCLPPDSMLGPPGVAFGLQQGVDAIIIPEKQVFKWKEAGG